MITNCRLNFKGIFVSAILSFVPAIASGAVIGIIFLNAFWFWVVGITTLGFFYICIDRVPTRLYAGFLRGLPFLQLLKYGYTSTDRRPIITEDMIRDENEWRTVTYNHFYKNDQ